MYYYYFFIDHKPWRLVAFLFINNFGGKWRFSYVDLAIVNFTNLATHAGFPSALDTNIGWIIFYIK